MLFPNNRAVFLIEGDDGSLIATRLSAQYPETNQNIGVLVLPLREYLVGKVRPALLILFGAVSLVLMIACANIANLFLVRATERSREFAIRAALAAERRHIVRQMVMEGLVLAVAGGLAGMLLANWLIKAILALSPGNLPRLNQITLNGSVLLFALGISALSVLFFGLVPALQFSRPDLQKTLKGEVERLPAEAEENSSANCSS